MSHEQRRGGHTVSWLPAHVVWVTKCRYHVLTGDVQRRRRDLIKQICDAEDVRMLKGMVSKDHVHMHIEYAPSQSISALLKRLKGRTSRRLQEEYPLLRKEDWERHFRAVGYGVWSTGNITDELVQQYLEHHREASNKDNDNIILS
ncbi:IS200/IS605 family transposase [Hymenobacter nivis]|uniref:IS200/IS605 family transposase n=1 Tax=Hymenobacter nivis TaxID=1850093 RepID=A0A2Z3GXA1_9BACT|nr:IS200/IS605 family transposase [Hymenobacter nivis]AWM33994.1 IS200/IS605 family transposase [Hymenobacter nivis]